MNRIFQEASLLVPPKSWNHFVAEVRVACPETMRLCNANDRASLDGPAFRADRMPATGHL